MTFSGEAVLAVGEVGVRANAGSGTQHGRDRRAGDQGAGSALRPLQNRGRRWVRSRFGVSGGTPGGAGKSDAV